MRSTWVAGLFVTVALLGVGSARAQGLCSELTFFGDSGTTAGCGDTRPDGTLLVEDLNGTPGIDCPGTNCDGGNYTFADWSDLIRVVLAGMHHDDADDIGMQDCNSDVRWSMVETWQNLFEGACTDSTCENARHLWRLPDDDAATATFLQLLGLPAIEAEPFCNGDELDDNDPIRRPCADGEDVCQPSGTLGLVLPIVPGPGSTAPCSLGVFRWKILPFTRFDCPQNINPLFGLCLQPQDAQGGFGCLNPPFNTSFGTPAGVDGRVHNLWPLNPDGTAPIVNGKELVAAFDRIHTANTIAEGASVCLEPTAGARIECLTEASPCSLGTECRREPQLFACSEQGIRDAIAAGGGPNRFACAGPTTVTTTSEIVIDNDVILDGEGNLTVDGNESRRVFSVAANITAELRGFTVRGGSADSGGGIYNDGTLTLTGSWVSDNTATDFGGGIFNDGALALTDSTVSDNAATDFGGGIFNDGALTLTDSIVSGNTADDAGGLYNSAAAAPTLTNSAVSGNMATYFGGGIYTNGALTLTNSTVSGNTAYIGGGAYGSGALTLTYSTVSSNTATENGGGISSYGPLTLTDSTVSGNSGRAGGGIHNRGTATLTDSTVSDNAATEDGGGIDNSSGTLMLTDSTVSGNSGRAGGGIYNDGTLTLTNSAVSGNTANIGGGIENYDTATLTLMNTTVSDNTARYGGGIRNRSTVATLTLTNSTVSGNTATEDGGGIDILRTSTLMLTDSTVSGNSGRAGGGIYNDGTLTLTHSTVSGNTADDGEGIVNDGTATLTHSVLDGDCVGAITSGGYNIESPGNTCGLTATGDQPTVLPDGPSGLNLGPLENNGGPTLTHAPQAPSAAIDQIPLAACELTTDQRGESRPETGGSMCDVGAVEVQ